MVAPYATGELVRSLIRIPGSGIDRTLTPVSLDLSRVSPLAAAIPVPQQLPAALVRPALQRQPATNTMKMSEKEDPAKSENISPAIDRRSHSQPQEVEGARGNTRVVQREASREGTIVAPPSKKSRIESSRDQHQNISRAQETQQQVFIPSGSAIVLVPVQLLQAQQLPRQQPASMSPSVASEAPQVSQLIRERDALRDENVNLTQRLSLFQQLFQDKKRLASVIQRFGVIP